MNDFSWLTALDSLGYDGARMLISLLWQSTIVFVVCGGLGFLLRKRNASTRHTLWTAALMSLPFLTIVALFPRNAPLPVSPIPVFPNYATVSPRFIIERQGFPEAVGTSSQNLSEKKASAPFRYPWLSAAVLYVAGVTILLVPIFMGRLRVRRWIDDGAPVLDERVIDICYELSTRSGIHRPIMAVESKNASVPFTMRFFHPVIVLPEGFSNSLTDTELRAVLAHETAHILRGDSVIGIAAVFIRSLFFFHPGVWWIAREIAILAEHACDDLALEVAETPISYARLVTRIAENAITRPVSMEYASGMIFSRNAFLRRVEAILLHRKEEIMKLTRPALIGIILIGGFSLVTAFALPLGETGKRADPVNSLGNDETLKKNIQIAQAVIPAVPVTGTSITGNTPDSEETKIQHETQSWLTLVDSGKYSESWKEASSLFRNAVKQDQWAQNIEKLRSPLGKVSSRKPISSTEKTSLPGAPEGKYNVNKFETTFSKNGPVIETLTLMLDTDGKWRVSGYFINTETAVREKAAQIAVQNWLKLVDSGKYTESWKEAAALFRNAVKQDQWVSTIEKIRSQSGKVVSREMINSTYATSLPGAPQGEYVVTQFKTIFAQDKVLIETITPMLENDGKWRVSGYFVK